ncbi:MAG: hypothetical protein HY739_13225 [Desulfobacterales bacterium]|nr:hypothetical protein [Desulfobacterales bacterium]
MRDEIISAFKLVVSNSETLETFSFKENIRNIKMVWTWHQDSPDELRIEGPNHEQVSAFLLIFRQFIQKKDRCSFKYLADHALDNPDVSDEWKIEFTKLRESLNEFLDAHPSFMPIQFSDEPMVSRHEILKTYISGMYAHGEKDKQELLEKWRGKHKILQGIFDTQFLRTVTGVYGAIVVLSKLCIKELDK